MFNFPSKEVGEIRTISLSEVERVDPTFRPIVETFSLLASTFGKRLDGESRRIKLPVLSEADEWWVVVTSTTQEITAWWYYNHAEDCWFWLQPGSGYIASSAKDKDLVGTVPSSEFRFPVTDLHAIIQTVMNASQSKRKLHHCIEELSSRKGWIICHGIGKYSLKFESDSNASQ
jgi:hypothetical protein